MKSFNETIAEASFTAAETIADSFTTMIQKMDETAITWRTFSDMVRNTLSDMFRNMAADILKNQFKEMVVAGAKSLSEKFGVKLPEVAKTPQEIATNALSTNISTNVTELAKNTTSIQALTNAINSSPGITGQKGFSSTPNSIGTPQNIDEGAISSTALDSLYNDQWDAVSKSAEAGKTQNSAGSKMLLAGNTFENTVSSFSAAVPNLVNGILGAVSSGGGSLRSVGSSLLPMLFNAAISSFGVPANIAAFSSMPFNDISAFSTAFANGGIMTSQGQLPLNTYANGGIANSPQIAMFGEGRKNEAYVPLPDNRTIPVTLSGGGGASITNGDTIVTVKINNSESGSSSTVDVEQSKKFSVSMAAAVKATVQEELIKQMRPRGLLNA
jgi:hypothetical protein